MVMLSLAMHFMTVHCTEMHSKLLFGDTFCSNAAFETLDRLEGLEEFGGPVGPKGPLMELGGTETGKGSLQGTGRH